MFQTGSGTSSNMNANEVIATLASERLGRRRPPERPRQRLAVRNDVFPSAIHIAATTAVVNDLVPALQALRGALAAQGGGVRAPWSSPGGRT